MATLQWAPADGTVVGREREVDRLASLMRSTRAGTKFVMLTGDAGIGKTALWRWALAQHRAAGHRVLVTCPSEDELLAPMTGLIDLFERADPEPAMLEPDVDVFDRGRAVLRTLRRLAAAGPVVVAIDDLQWLDAVSARTLRHALRRLDTEPILMLVTERVPGVRRGAVLPAERLEEIVLGPLSIEATRDVVLRVVGTISRPVLERVHALSGGNPMYAIELARSGALVDGLGRAPVKRLATLHGVIAARLGDVAPGRLAVLRTAAALGPATAAELARMCPGPDDATVIADALDDGTLVMGEDGLVRFDHPLVASVILDTTNPLQRKVLHAHLAALVTDPDARARHLALSRGDPDAAIAAELEAAAGRAGRRGAASVAAELAGHSVRVTPPGDVEAASRRALAGISFWAAAGEPERAVAMTDELLAGMPNGATRLEAITLRVFLDIDRGEEVLSRALAEAGDDVRWRGRVLELLGWLLATYRGQLAPARQLGQEALAIARGTGDEELEMLAAATLSTTTLLAGRPAPGLIDRALDLASRHEPPRLGRWPQLFRARHSLWDGNLDEARRRFESMRTVFLERGTEFQRPYRLSDLAWVEVAAGNLHSAVDLTDDARAAALDAGNPQATAWGGYPAGLAYAHLGRHADAAEVASELRRWAGDHDQPPRLLMALHLLGLVALTSGDAARAAAELEPAVALAARLGYRHPGYLSVVPDAIEAAALAGDASTCARLLTQLDAEAAALGSPWVHAARRRAQGLAALGTGRGDPTRSLVEAAVAFDALGHRLDAARTTLLHGRALRRSGRRAAAADALRDAGRRFAAMGARPWEAQAAAELERVAPTRPAGGMTATERKIADLVLAGRRNREIAADLFVSVATVEAHLTRIYRKLGVRSRTELSTHLRHTG